MDRKRLSMLGLLFALALIATACSGGGDPAEEGEGEEATEAGAEETDAGAATSEPAAEDTGAAETEPTAEDTGAAETEPETATGEGGSYSIYIGEPEALLPPNSNESEGNQVLQALFTNLIEYDPETTESVNAIASSIETEDSQTFTITINEGWTFHNGEEITAQTFVDSWNFATDPENAYANSFFYSDIEGADEAGLHGGEGLEGLEVVDDTTFTVTLKQPFSQWPLRLGYRAFSPLAEECRNDPEACNEQPIGNGPYQMTGPWEHDVAINVERFEDYAGEAGVADAIEFRIYSDVNTAYTDVEAGNLDIVAGVPGELVEQARETFGERFVERPISTFTYVGFPLYDERFQAKELRQAFSLAIDREAITSTILPQQFPADSLISPVVPGYREGACQYCTYDPEQAATLLEQAGGFEGPLTLWFNSGAGHELWMEAVANNLRDNLGIQEITFESREFADYLSNFADANAFTGPFRLGWGMDYPSPQNYLEPLYFFEADSNSTDYNNPEFEELVRQGNAAADEAEALELYAQAEDLVLEDMPVIPMFFSNAALVHSENVTEVPLDAFDVVRVESVVPAS